MGEPGGIEVGDVLEHPGPAEVPGVVVGVAQDVEPRVLQDGDCLGLRPRERRAAVGVGVLPALQQQTLQVAHGDVGGAEPVAEPQEHQRATAREDVVGGEGPAEVEVADEGDVEGVARGGGLGAQ